MAITYASTETDVPGDATRKGMNFGLDNNYPALGYNLDTTQIGGLIILRRMISIRPKDFVSSQYFPVMTITYGPYGAISAMNLRLRLLATGAEVATGTDVSAASIHCIFEGN